MVSILVLEDEKGGRCECGLTWTSGIRKRNSGTDSLRIEEHFCFTNGLITCLLFVISIGISCILHTVFPRIEAPGLYWYNFVRPPACIRGPACIQGPASISTTTSDGLYSRPGLYLRPRWYSSKYGMMLCDLWATVTSNGSLYVTGRSPVCL